MTQKEAIKILKRQADGYYPKTTEALIIAIKALEQEPCEDAISREAVDDYIAKLMSGYLYDEERTRLEEFSAYLWELQSVTPQPKTGYWKRVEHGLFDSVSIRWECSECKKSDRFRSNFCFNCGARMESEVKE